MVDPWLAQTERGDHALPTLDANLYFGHERRRSSCTIEDVQLVLRPRETNVEKSTRLALLSLRSTVPRNPPLVHCEQHDHAKFAAFGAVQCREVDPVSPITVPGEYTQSRAFIVGPNLRPRDQSFQIVALVIKCRADRKELLQKVTMNLL